MKYVKKFKKPQPIGKVGCGFDCYCGPVITLVRNEEEREVFGPSSSEEGEVEITSSSIKAEWVNLNVHPSEREEETFFFPLKEGDKITLLYFSATGKKYEFTLLLEKGELRLFEFQYNGTRRAFLQATELWLLGGDGRDWLDSPSPLAGGVVYTTHPQSLPTHIKEWAGRVEKVEEFTW